MEVKAVSDSLARQAKRLIDKGRTAEALELLEESLAAGEDERTALNLAGYAHFKRGDDAAAEAVYRRLVAMPDAHPRDQYNLATVLKRRGKASEAKIWFEAATAADPGLGEPRKAAGRASAAGARRPEPIKEFDIPRDDEELERYKRLSRERARVDLMTEIWYRHPWPIRILQVVFFAIFVAIWAFLISGAAGML